MNYITLSDPWRKIGSTYEQKCDKGDQDMDGINWFRFVEPAGTVLPTSPNVDAMQSHSACGADSAAWISERHPTPNEGVVNRTACFAWAMEECFRSVGTIGVGACNVGGVFYYVYQLKHPQNCFLAYCTY